MKKLIIVEKPKVATQFSTFLKMSKVPMTSQNFYFENEKFLVVHSFGHIFRLKDAKEYDSKYAKWELENFPIIPNKFEYVANDQGNTSQNKVTLTQIDLIFKLINRNDIDGVINGCDPDREGESIGTNIYKMSKTTKPFYRILYNAITQKDIVNALNNLIPSKDRETYINGADARMNTDWLIGINFTSVATLTMSDNQTTINVGRVIMPTLKFVYDREQEIKNFVPETYYCIVIDCTFKNGMKINTVYQDTEGNYKFSETKANEIIKSIQINNLKIEIEQKLSNKNPSKLFDLSSFASYMLKKYNIFTGEEITKIYQTLYEQGYLSYTRTNSRYISETEIDKFKEVLKIHAEALGLNQQVEFHTKKSVFDSSKVDSHSANTPTEKIPDLSSLNEKEVIVYTEIRNSFLAQFMKPAVYKNISLKISDGEYDFYGSTKYIVEVGYLSLYDQKEKANIDFETVEYETNLYVHPVNKSKPSLLTESELINLMKSAGRSLSDEDEFDGDVLSEFSVGTHSTIPMAANHLIKLGYIKKKGKMLQSTDTGKNLVEKFPASNLFDPVYTGKMQQLIKSIETGSMSVADYYFGLHRYIESVVEKIKHYEGESLIVKLELGECPKCNSPIYEEKGNFSCSNKECDFIIYAKNKFLENYSKDPLKVKPIKDKDIKKIIEGKYKCKLYSKNKDKEFLAHVGLDENFKYLKIIEFINK